MPTVPAMRLSAMSLDMPTAAHANKHPFDGVLVFCDQVSTSAPEGTNFKKIILTRVAAERALPSLLGMGVNVSADFKAHSPQTKVGVITGARLDGDAVHVAGHLFKSDSPAETAAIQAAKGDLGFSFEARDISVLSLDEPVLTITGLTFTGACIIAKAAAAYALTSLAASAAKKEVVRVHPVLFSALMKAGFERCEDPEDRLSARQMAALMDQAPSIAARIDLKIMADRAGILPVDAR